MNRYLFLLVPALLVGCGTLPQPFLGRPGREGAVLSVPPPPVLIIPPPHDALLGNSASHLYANDLAKALVAEDVPSIMRPAGKFDWRLIARAKLSGDQVIPTFTIMGPTGKVYGQSTGAAVSGQAWSDGNAATLNAAATSAAPDLAQQLGTINASVQQSNPRSLENRPARALLAQVSGAPGDGDHALALDVRRDLAQLGVVLVEHKQDADFIISGVVKVSPSPHQSAVSESDIVELDWLVHSQSGAFIGKVSQLHDLAPAQVAPYWGDVAVAAAQQAALGIKQVIVNAIPKRAVVPLAAATSGESAKPVRPPAP
ncbi:MULTISPECIES: hypothetical protein [Acidiphilium]|uniref:Lipoprotein n=1 Tax=Acidiphilium rubrum TaxID=526 RepID=A0A8G2CMQ7_ACIRU|nr:MULTISPECIES: hypothetical protein [Acidiphilium]SIR04526.1 hypothetical protein SAMN05421828_11437 [Acidiphilium rubrum]